MDSNFEICRTCLSETYYGLYLFEYKSFHNIVLTISEMIQMCTTVVVNIINTYFIH